MNHQQEKHHYIIFSAPSGSGKTTLVHQMMKKGLPLSFSISATSRLPRKNEIDGDDYYFIREEEFKKRIEKNEFIEWEEVYADVHYGTLKSELDRIFSLGKTPVFDVDVIGGLQLKKLLGDEALSIFVQVSSIDELAKRLKSRATDNQESIQKRIDKTAYELTFASQFDQVIINDNLDEAVKKTYSVIKSFIDE